MRQLLVTATLLSALAASGHAAQDPPQRFRATVDLITIDVTAVDSKGRPVEDLKPGDFTVKVDGRPREVVSAQLIKVERGSSMPTRPVDVLVSTNVTPRNPRRIIVAVDQTLIAPGMIAPLLKTASQFVDRLQPSDYAAFVAFPEPGPRVDFTTDKARVRTAMSGIIGQPQQETLAGGSVNVSLSEALMITGVESVQDASEPPQNPPPGLEGGCIDGNRPIEPTGMPGNPDQRLTCWRMPQLLVGEAMRRVLERRCIDLDGQDVRRMNDENWFQGLPPEEQNEKLGALRRCRREVYSVAMRVASAGKADADISLRALEQLLRDLIPLEGPKSMVVFSAGLVNDNPAILREIGRLAAQARTTINVIAVDRQREQDQMARGASTGLLDRSYETQGLELVADNTGGTLFRGIATGAGIFERLESELSAWYLVGVERRPDDPVQQRVEVEIKRRGVSVRSNKTVVIVPPEKSRALDDVLSDALSSPFAMSGVPLRVTTFTHRDVESGKYRLRLAAEVGQPGEPPAEYAVGYALANDRGRVLATGGSRKALSPLASGPDQRLHYDVAMKLDPGSYVLRFGVVHQDGRRGTVQHLVTLPILTDNEITTSDLIVGNLPTEGEALQPSAEPLVTASELAGHLELYLSNAERDRVSVTLDIAEGELSPALATASLALGPGQQPSWRVATGFVDARITPGRYIARATVRREDSGEVITTRSRPISIVRDPGVVSRVPPRPIRGIAVTPELQRRTATYIAGVVNGLANIVGQEEFALSGPDRRVVSDLLLVRYPGAIRDLLPYRDVSSVNGTSVANRQQRLLDLFVKPPADIRERARQIMLDADAQVPSMFNPIFVLGFLQADYQSRFDLTVSDAGSEWPREVKAVSFVERGRPTMLRTGPFGDVDVPTRGTAWIEEGTGRILQTELEVGRGRRAPKMVTKFSLDARLQVMVPVEMRTENPDGVATYTNFRRFGVDASSLIPDLVQTAEPR